MISPTINRVRALLPNGQGIPWPTGLAGNDVRVISLFLILFWLLAYEIFDGLRHSLQIRDPIGGGSYKWTDAHDEILYAALYVIAVLGIVYGTLRRRGLDWRAVGLAPPNKHLLVFGSCIGFLLFGLECLVDLAITYADPDFAASDDDVSEELVSGWFAVFTDLSTSVFVFPILEEIYFRGVLFTWMIRTRSRFHAYLVSSVIFAVYHLRFDALDFVDLVVAGLVFAWVYERTRSLWASVAVHGANNFAITVYNYALFA